jgi:hypothetical protein
MWNESGCPLGPSDTCGGPTTPASTTARCSARQLLSESSGTAVQAPDATFGFRMPSPCSVIGGPKLTHRSLGGWGDVTAFHWLLTHSSGIVSAAGHVIAPDSSGEHGVSGCGESGSADATTGVESSSTSVVTAVVVARTGLHLRQVGPHQHHVVLRPQRQVPVQVGAGPHG